MQVRINVCDFFWYLARKNLRGSLLSPQQGNALYHRVAYQSNNRTRLSVPATQSTKTFEGIVADRAYMLLMHAKSIVITFAHPCMCWI
jgi:hypothetical protein